MLALGLALAALYLARQAGRPRLARYQHDSKDYEIVGSETDEVGTRFGKVVFETPVGRRVDEMIIDPCGTEEWYE